MNVLIADDNDINRQFLRGVLEPEAITVQEATDGHEAVELFRNDRFELVFMDIRMPGMDGLEATRAIRDLPGFDPVLTRIVALTADLRVQQKKDLLQQGFDACLTKPVSRQTLLDLIWGLHPSARPADNQIETSTADPYLDREAALSAAGGNRELVERLAQMLRRELSQFLPLIDSALANDQFDQARDLVHKIRGSAGYCGARVLQSEAEGLEMMLSNQDSAKVNEHMEAFRIAADATHRALGSN